jgi:hypothetical protein
MSEKEISQAEQSSVTKPTVVAGLGYPADRKEESPEPTGWLDSNDTNLEKI